MLWILPYSIVVINQCNSERYILIQNKIIANFYAIWIIRALKFINFMGIFSSKDVRLPSQLQRAMAAEAEAAREARAKVSRS